MVAFTEATKHEEGTVKNKDHQKVGHNINSIVEPSAPLGIYTESTAFQRILGQQISIPKLSRKVNHHLYQERSVSIRCDREQEKEDSRKRL
jgi:hypothetical protein